MTRTIKLAIGATIITFTFMLLASVLEDYTMSVYERGILWMLSYIALKDEM
jgi:hypothetical protein